MLALLRLFGSIADALESFTYGKLRKSAIIADYFEQFEFDDGSRQLWKNMSKKEKNHFINWYAKQEEIPKGGGAKLFQKGKPSINEEKLFTRLSRFKRINKARQVVNFGVKGPALKFKTAIENLTDIQGAFKKLFGKQGKGILEMILGFKVEEFLGFLNAIRNWKNLFLHIDPSKITKDLMRAVSDGVGSVFGELSELSGHDTMEISDSMEISMLTSSWMNYGIYDRTGGQGLATKGNLWIWTNKGHMLYLTDMPIAQWEAMKGAKGKFGHWYAPLGAGSYYWHFIKTGGVFKDLDFSGEGYFSSEESRGNFY